LGVNLCDGRDLSRPPMPCRDARLGQPIFATATMPTVLYRRAFNRAAEILGGEERLARFLNAEQNELRYWKHRRPPLEALQLVAGLLMHQLLKKHGQSALRTK
jgi:hypothetical protein